MKTLKNLGGLLFFLFILFAQFAPDKNELRRSTTCENITVEYADNVPNFVAVGVANTMAKARMAGDRVISVELRNEETCYRLTCGVVNNRVTPDARATFEFFARVMTDQYSPNKPIVTQLVTDDSKQVLALLEPVAPMGTLRVHNNDYLYFSDNISEADATEIAEGFERIGWTSSGTTVARVIRTDNEFVAYVCPAGDEDEYQSEAFAEQMVENADVFRAEVFAQAQTKLVCSQLNLEPYPGLEWTSEGIEPGQQVKQIDNIIVIYDETISEECAIDIATRFPARGLDNDISLTVTDEEDNNFQCEMSSSAEHIETLRWVIGYWGREVLSEIPNAESLKLVITDDEAVLLSRECTEGHGEYLMYCENRLFYPCGTSSETIDAVQKGLQSVGLFEDDAECIVRFTQVGATPTVQIAFPPGVDAEELKEELEPIGKGLAGTAFPERSIRLEFTDLDFSLLGDCAWLGNAEGPTVEQVGATR